MRKATKKLGWIIMTAVLFVAWFNLFTVTSKAYIDPSVVTYIIQAVAGVTIAIGAALTIFRHKIAAFFRKNKREANKREVHFVDDSEMEGNK